MAKIYIVTRIYKDIDRSGDTDYSETSIVKVFDSAEKAIDYIRNEVKNAYERVDETDPKGDKLVKYFVPDTIMEGKDIAVYESYGMFRQCYGCTGVYYNYISKDVE